MTVCVFKHSSLYREHLNNSQVHMGMNFICKKLADLETPLQVATIIASMPWAFCIHQGCCTWRVKKSLDPKNNDQIFP
jgi:hypothetical protein